MGEKMIILEGGQEKENDLKTYIVLGNFDGLHKGHMGLINRVVDEALLNSCRSLVYTFKNHPLSVASPDNVPKLLMDNEQKIHLLKTAGVDVVAMIDFTMEYMKTSPEDFVKHLISDFGAVGLVVGFNYKFGYMNEGDVEMLRSLCEKYGLDLQVIEAMSDEKGLISSTRIRELISEGKVSEADELLLEPFMLRGTVTEGRRNGKAMGFPTANMEYGSKYLIPKEGVYYTNVLIDNRLYRGITSVGKNPTLGEDNPVTVETYILDFNEDIYGKEMKLYFLEWMRDMIKYDNIDSLIDQLRKDNNYAASRPMAELRTETENEK